MVDDPLAREAHRPLRSAGPIAETPATITRKNLKTNRQDQNVHATDLKPANTRAR